MAMALVVAIVTCACLLLIRSRLREQVTKDLAQDLTHSVTAFQDLQTEKIRALDRENSLLARRRVIRSIVCPSTRLRRMVTV